MTEENVPFWVYKAVTGFVAFVSGIWIKSWVDKYAWKGGKERRKDGNYLVINEQMIERIVKSFEDHTKTMQEVASSLHIQTEILKDHIEEDRESYRLLQQIHNKVVGQ